MEGMEIDAAAVPAGDGHSPFDLAKYASNYTGHTKVNRLMFIVDRFPDELANEAFTMALKAVQQGHDTRRYQEIMAAPQHKERLQALGIEANDKWLRERQKESDVLQGQLESRVNSAKNSNDAGRIWDTYIALGDFWYQRGVFDGGDNQGARSCYFHAKDHVSDSLFPTWCLNITKTYLMMAEADTRHYQRAINFSAQAKSKSRSVHGGNDQFAVEVHMSEGLFHLHNYLKECDAPQVAASKTKTKTQGDTLPLSYAANNLIKISFDQCGNAGSIMSKQDVALYASLCALASFSRAQLKAQVIDNLEFHKFLALVPEVKALVYHLYQFRYAEFVSSLNTLLKTWLPYDMHLSKHATKLCTAIRGAAMVQYATPYTRILMSKMATAFGCEAEELEDDLILLINNSKLDGRIDSYNQVYVINTAQPRARAFKAVLEAGSKNLVSTDSLLLRASCLEHGLGIYHAASVLSSAPGAPLLAQQHAAQGELPEVDTEIDTEVGTGAAGEDVPMEMAV